MSDAVVNAWAGAEAGDGENKATGGKHWARAEARANETGTRDRDVLGPLL